VSDQFNIKNLPPLGTRDPGFRQSMVLGVNTKAPLQPGVRTKLKAMPQMSFKMEKLVIPDEYKDASVYGMTVGGQQELVSAQPLPGAMFSPSAFGTQLQVRPAHPGMEIELEVSRPEGGPFNAAFIGTQWEDPEPEIPALVEEAAKAQALVELAEKEKAP